MGIFDTVIVQPIFNLLLGIYSLVPGGDFGLVIIIFTVVVRFALWPLIKKQLHQAKAMKKMQPELAKIKKESGGNKQLESVQMMELYKRYDINPLGSIGVLFIQLPIFIALYKVIRILALQRTEIEKYTYGFMKGLEPVKALIENPDNFNQKLFGLVDLTKHAASSVMTADNIVLLVLVIISVVMQYIMTKQTMASSKTDRRFKDIMSEAAAGKQADQAEMNAIMARNMTKVTPIMMFFVMVSLPGALVLYYMMSNLVAVIQQHIILKKDSEELVKIADKAKLSPVPGKKATAKAREKETQEAVVIRIKAKDDTPRAKNKV